MIFYEPFLGGKKDSGDMKTLFIRDMDSLVQCCKPDLPTIALIERNIYKFTK